MNHELGPLPDLAGDWAMDFKPTANVVHVSKAEEYARAYALSEVEKAVKAERERCAQICEEVESEYQRRDGWKFPELRSDAQEGAATCAARIRKGQS